MAWIESHQALLTHRKTLKAAALLKVSKYLLIGHLHALWWWSLDNADDDGSLGKALSEEIAEASGWPLKRADEWLSVLVEVGFIDRVGVAYVLHNWYDYAGKLNRQRAANKQRMRDARAEHVQDTVQTRVGLPTNQPPPLPTNQHNPPTNGTKPALKHLLDLSPIEVTDILKDFPDSDVNGRWKEWISWIEEERERRMPKDKVEAFKGWLRRKQTTGPAA